MAFYIRKVKLFFYILDLLFNELPRNLVWLKTL